MAVTTDKDVAMVLKSLKTNRFAPVEFASRGEDAAKLVLDMIPPLEATVGVAGSATVRQIGLVNQLKERGTTVVDVAAPSELSIDEIMKRTLDSDILLTSSNAVTLDGKLVNIDATGNRVAAMIFGPKKVILVIGANKIVRDVDEAINRIKNVIAPYIAMYKGRKTPCAIHGRCTDCNSLDRICRVTTIIEKKPSRTDIAIVLVGEDLGLGWDPAWPEERKERIKSVFKKQRNYPP